MLKAEQIQSLSKNNQSVDAQKTKERIKAVWIPLDAKTRAEILKLCGLTQFAIQKTYAIGTVSAKTVCAISQTLKINPYYLIGESDEKDYFTDDTVSDFLRNKNLSVAKKSGKAKAVKAEKTVKTAQVKTVMGNNDAEETSAVPKTTAAASVAVSKIKTQTESSGDYERNALNKLGGLASGLFASLPNAVKDKIEKIPEDELSVLLNAMVTRAKINDDNNNLLKLIKYILSC